MSKHWDNYWKTNNTSSFGQQTPEWYRETLEPFWDDIFTRQPGNSRILDIATGNGAVIKRAARISAQQDKHFTLVAADKAQKIQQTNAYKATDPITYLPGLGAENIDFSAQPFDVVCSQFGIEYSNLNQTLPRLKLSLAPDGSIFIIAHQKHSFIYHQSKKEIEDYRLLLQHYPVFKRIDTLLKTMGELKSTKDIENLQSNPASIKAREAFNLLVAKILDKHSDSVVIAEFLNRLKPLFQQLMLTPLPHKKKFLNNIKKEMGDARQRLLDMISAAMSENDLKQFLLLANKHDLKAEYAESIQDSKGNLLGWKIQLDHEHH